MMARNAGVYAAVAALLALAGLLGWVQAGIGAFSVNANQGEWHEPPVPIGGKDISAKLKERLLASGYFDAIGEAVDESTLPLPEDASAMAIAERDYGKFPHIISIARLDSEDTAQLKLEDDTILTVRAGDVLDSGWAISEIFQGHLLAEAGPESFSFAVIEHKDSQELEALEE